MKHPERNFRKNHYWHIPNYNAKGRLPRSLFQRAMKHVPEEFLDEQFLFGGVRSEVLYQLADRFCSGREGHCFGMSVAAVKEWHKEHEDTGIAEIRKVTPSMEEKIMKLHLMQLEGDYLLFVAKQLANRQIFASPRAIQFIVTLIRKEGCVLVNLVNIRELAGHTVVAYDYEYDRKNHSYVVYVADSNHPWKKSEELNFKEGANPSYIRLSMEEGRYKAKLHYGKVVDKVYDCVFGVPYKYIQ